MISTIALVIIAIAICVLVVIYHRKREDLVQQLSDIDYSLADMRTKLNKLDNINNKLLAIENKVQTSVDRIASVKNYIETDVTMYLTSTKAGQEIYTNNFYSKANKLQDTVDNLVKEHSKINQELINTIYKRIVDIETRTGLKLNTINERLDAIGGSIVIALEGKEKSCGAKNSSKPSKVKNTTKTNKQENEKLKTAE